MHCEFVTPNEPKMDKTSLFVHAIVYSLMDVMKW